MDAGGSWVVVRTKAHQENWAAENAIRQGFEIYLPRLLKRLLKPPMLIPNPVFPNYLFIRYNANWRRLLGTFGVTGIIRMGEAPATLTDKTLQQLRARERQDGFIVLPSPPPKFALNSKVKVEHGVFSGQIGLCRGMGPSDRTRVLLDLLGRKIEILVHEDALSKAA
jgi:transcriptional antiterminator RfaH